MRCLARRHGAEPRQPLGCTGLLDVHGDKGAASAMRMCMCMKITPSIGVHVTSSGQTPAPVPNKEGARAPSLLGTSCNLTASACLLSPGLESLQSASHPPRVLQFQNGGVY